MYRMDNSPIIDSIVTDTTLQTLLWEMMILAHVLNDRHGLIQIEPWWFVLNSRPISLKHRVELKRHLSIAYSTSLLEQIHYSRIEYYKHRIRSHQIPWLAWVISQQEGYNKRNTFNGIFFITRMLLMDELNAWETCFILNVSIQMYVT